MFSSVITLICSFPLLSFILSRLSTVFSIILSKIYVLSIFKLVYVLLRHSLNAVYGMSYRLLLIDYSLSIDTHQELFTDYYLANVACKKSLSSMIIVYRLLFIGCCLSIVAYHKLCF